MPCLRKGHATTGRSAVGRPSENGRVERLTRTLRAEEASLHEHDAYGRIGEFLTDVYTRERIHSALGDLAPEEFETGRQANPPGITQAVASWYPGLIACPILGSSTGAQQFCWCVVHPAAC
ncbi:MAG: integrase core domain-containing protein [Candidatus Poribacteria bacterium]